MMEKKQMSHAEIHESLYEGFKHTLDESTIQRLRVIGDKRCADSTFILTCITKIYGNAANLNEVSACGRKKNKETNYFLFDKENIENMPVILIDGVDS